MNDKIRVGIFGASGMVAGELLRWLLFHPEVEIQELVSEHLVDVEAVNVHPFLLNKELPLFSRINFNRINECSVVFFTKQQSYTSNILKDLNPSVKVIDLAQGFRLKNVKDYEKWFGDIHLYPEIVERFVYGLSEVYREDIKSAQYLANPGCYPTSVLLGLYPLMKENSIKESIVVNSFSGLTGAGKKLNDNLLFINNYNTIHPYKVGKHQHTIEIETYLNDFSSDLQDSVNTLFLAHTAPFNRGIVSIATINNYAGPYDILKLYTNYYGSETFIRIFDNPDKLNINNVINTNYCHIAPIYDKRTNSVVIYSMIDNLVKGAAGQAIQNMNIMFGLPEHTGLL